MNQKDYLSQYSIGQQRKFKFVDNAVQGEQMKSKNDRNLQRIKNKAEKTIEHLFISGLLQPRFFLNLSQNARFLFKPEHIIQLCDKAEAVIKMQPMVLRCSAPIKIFGDIHGQYSGLMRFFDLWGSPSLDSQVGDIEEFDYLFLGNYVDKGAHSLETICLLLALKIKYPDQIHLLRGNHEDIWINNGFGFSEECSQRLGEDPNDDSSVFVRVNRVFEWLPLAAIIEDKIICLHSGVGASLNYISDIEQLKRPLEVIHNVTKIEEQFVIDILWSTPTDSDEELGIQPLNWFRPSDIVKYGPDRVIDFLNKNGLSMIIRSNQCVMDGFERFAGGKLVTLFSAPDYCGKHKNAGAILLLKLNWEIVPKIIYPYKFNSETVKNALPPTPPRWKSQSGR